MYRYGYEVWSRTLQRFMWDATTNLGMAIWYSRGLCVKGATGRVALVVSNGKEWIPVSAAMAAHS